MKTLGLLTALVLAQLAFGQERYDNHKTMEIEKTKNSITGILGISESGKIFALARTKKPSNPIINIIDPNTGKILHEVKAGEITDLKSKNFKILNLYYFANSIVLVGEKKDAPNKFFAVRLDENGKIKGDLVEVGSGPGDGKRCVNYCVLQPTRGDNFCFLTTQVCKNEFTGDFRAVQVDEGLNIVSDTKFKIELADIDRLTFVFSKLHLYFTYEDDKYEKVEGKLKKQKKTDQFIYKVDLKNGNVSKLDLNSVIGEEKTGKVGISFSNELVQIVGQSVNHLGIDGIFTAVLNETTNEVSNVRTQKFSEEFITQYMSESSKDIARKRPEMFADENDGDEEDKYAFSDKYRYVESIASSDGGTSHIFQFYRTYTKSYTTYNSNGAPSTNSYRYFVYGNILVIKTNKAGEITSTNLIECEQQTVNYNPIKGYNLILKDDGLYFLHTKSPDPSNGILDLTHINSNGEMKTYYVMNVSDYKAYVSANYIFENKNENSFVFSSFGKSSYLFKIFI